MTAKKHHATLTFLLIIVLCINLLNVQLVHADEGTPTEPPAPTQVETEPATEPPAEPTATSVDAVPTLESLEQTATPEPISEEGTQEPVISSPTPENTDLVVLDEAGQPLVLGSQETADALASSAPVWCPDSVSTPTPGTNGCSISYASITALLLAMQTDPGSFSQNGTIFLEQTAGQALSTPLILDDSSTSLGTAFNSLTIFNLTVQGGWDPETGSTSDQTILSGSNAYVQVGSSTNPWIGSVTLNNLIILSVTSTTNASLVVSSSGSVELNNITVVGSGAGQDAISISASNVALNNVNASYADVNGISITASEAGTVALNNVNASNNGHTGDSGPVGSGVSIDGADTLISIVGSSFNNNALFGIEAWDSTSTSMPAANLWTDQEDYAPGSVVTISGNDNSLNGEILGFEPGETIFVLVQGPNGYTAICQAVADAYGGWSCQITLWDSELAIGAYTYTATGLRSGITETRSFTDARPNSVSVGAQSPSPVTAGNAATYTVTVNFNGSGSSCTSPLSVTSGLPSGASASFNPASVTSTGGSVTSTLTITTTAATPAGSHNFTVLASNGGGSCQPGTATSQGSLIVAAASGDATPPVISRTITGTAGANGWYTGDVFVDWTVTDPESSFTMVGCADTTISTDTPGITLSCSATSAGGTSSDSATIKRDASPPTGVSGAPARAPDQGTWYNHAVDLVFTGTDATSGIASCSTLNYSGPDDGAITVSGSCTDNAGNVASGFSSAFNYDGTAPTLTLPADITLEATSAAGASVSYSVSAVDNLATPVNLSCSPASGSTFPIANTTVNCSATDAAGNTSNSSFQVTVQDTGAPVISPHGDEAVEATSSAGAIVLYTSPSASDAIDGPVAVTCMPASGTLFAIGDTSVACNAMDTHGNLATPVTFTVHVLDTTPPALSLPGNMTVYATGPAGAIVTYSATAADIVAGSVPVICSPASGLPFPVGSTQVHCSATDGHGNTATGSFFINVLDASGPVISIPAGLIAEATGPAGAIVSYTASATDTVDGPLPVSCIPPSGSSFGLGTTAVSCSATDSDGNTNTASFFVTVRDTTPPTISAHADIITSTSSAAGAVVSYTRPSTLDAVDGAGSASCSPASGTLFPIGDTQVTCTAADSHGNTATSTFLVRMSLTQGTSTPAPEETTSSLPPTSSSLIIPQTGGQLIDLDCDSVLWTFGIRLSFFSLCNHQAILNSVGALDLPAALPEGFSFVMGLDVQIQIEDQVLSDLPEGSGIEMDFPLYDQARDQFAVLYWSDPDGDGQGEWIEIAEQIARDEISKIISEGAGEELYQLSADPAGLFYEVVTGEQTGTFILVKK